MPAPGHDPFLRAICENPEDDAPRLIYADWLDENGDADRAEFIRLQIGTGDNEAVEVLTNRLRCEELFRTNHRRWVVALPGPAALWSTWGEVYDGDAQQLTWADSHPMIEDWERGFPATVYAQTDSDVFMSSLDEIRQFVPVHRLRLIALPNANVFFSMLSLSPFLNKIRELIVPPDIILRDLPVTAIANSPHANQLRQLSLVAELLSDSTGMALANSLFLRDIDMLHLLRNHFSEKVLAALRARYGFRVHC